MNRHTAQSVIASRLLVLQSKRLMLSSLQRNPERPNADAARERIEHLRNQTMHAEGQYRSCVLRLGTPDNHDFWLVAYARLIETGNGLVRKLSSTADALPAVERYEAATDVEALEGIIQSWTDAMRAAMTVGVA